jgi:hypothetical protein
MWSRIYLIPLLQAEEDRSTVRLKLADQAREKELLGSVTNPYHGDRYVVERARQRELLFLRFFFSASLVSRLEDGQPRRRCMAVVRGSDGEGRRTGHLGRGNKKLTMGYRFVPPTYATTPQNAVK